MAMECAESRKVRNFAAAKGSDGGTSLWGACPVGLC